jgi:prepilin signal peptidase PulO-like enzyme (type II secretory pathway)
MVGWYFEPNRTVRLDALAFVAGYGLTFVLHQGFQFHIALLLVPLLVWISVADVRFKEVPDLPTVGLITYAAFEYGWPTDVVMLEEIRMAALVVLPLYIVSEIIWSRRGVDVFGVGDVKLLGAGIVLVGTGSAWLMILLASLGGIVACLVSKGEKGGGFPFAPFLCYAIFIVHLASGEGLHQ